MPLVLFMFKCLTAMAAIMTTFNVAKHSMREAYVVVDVVVVVVDVVVAVVVVHEQRLKTIRGI